jgi:predicted CXXCH cytochrome family protein
MRHNTLITMLAVPAVALVLGLTGCVDERIVYKDRELFETPPTGAAGFVGYSKAEDKLTGCGNCHIGQQVAWKETAHAGAWDGLQSSGHAQAFCEGCHTVSELGNIASEPAGWNTTKDARYKDVQCESCHGPGLQHMQNPSKATISTVLAPLAAREGTNAWYGCAQCHQGTHHPYGEEWLASRHGGGPNTAYAGGRDACKECHTAEDALIKFGINANYLEKSTHLPSLSENMSITCAVCHDPHGAQHAGQLRKSLSEADLSKNLCMKCHYKRGVPDPTTFRGPHSPEGPTLLGEGGWWPDTLTARFPTGRVESTHGAVAANPKLCAGCHMRKFEYKDETGATIHGTGHTFEAIPCVDANGKPSVKGNCADTERTFKTCTGAGCHGSEGVARSAVATVGLRMQNLAAELDKTLQKVHSNWRTCRQYNPPDARACPTYNGKVTFNTADNLYTVAEGAGFNWDLAQRASAAIHNPLLMESLLISTIQQLRKEYNITSAMTVDLTPQLVQH